MTIKRLTAVFVAAIIFAVGANLFPVMAAQGEISAPPTVMKPPNTRVSQIQLSAQIDGDATGFTWSVQGPSKLSVNSQGVLTLRADAAEGVYTIKAEKGGTVLTKEISVAEGYFDNFDSAEYTLRVPVPSVAGKYTWSLQGAVRETLSYSGQNALAAGGNGNWGAKLIFDNALPTAGGITTIEGWGALETITQTGGAFARILIGEDISNYIVGHELFSTNGSTACNFKPLLNNEGVVGTYPNLIPSFNKLEWRHIKIEANFDNRTYDLYVGGEKLAENYKMRKDMSEYSLKGLFFGSYVDDLMIYSGKGQEALNTTVNIKTSLDGDIIQTPNFNVGLLRVDAELTDYIGDAMLIAAQFKGEKRLNTVSVASKNIDGDGTISVDLDIEMVEDTTVKIMLFDPELMPIMSEPVVLTPFDPEDLAGGL